MNVLRHYLNTLSPRAQASFAVRCQTTIGYLRKAISVGQKISERLAINIERESNGTVRCEDLRPDVDWAYLRGTAQHHEVA